MIELIQGIFACSSGDIYMPIVLSTELRAIF